VSITHARLQPRHRRWPRRDGHGKLYARSGKRAQAQEHLTTAATLYREMHMHFWLKRADAELA
jgi:hypothetical protein